MTTLNLATIAKIQFIAECAHEDVALTTLKNAKDGITNRSKIHAGYESQWQGVDRAEVLAAFEQPMDCSRKADFTRRLELLLETMQNMVIEHEKAAEARRAAEAHQNTVMNYTGADFIDELYDAHTEALDEEHARNVAAGIVVKDSWARACPEALEQDAAPVISEAEAMQVTFWGANDYAARRALVELAHTEALAEDKARRLAARTGFTVEQCHAELIAEEGNFLEARLNLLAIVVEAHGEALTMDARHDARTARQAQESKRHRDTIEAAHVEAIEADKERTAYRLWSAYLNEDFAGRRRMMEAAHVEALALDRVYNVMHSDFVDPVRRDAIAANLPAADIDAIDIRTLHEPLEDEAALPYAQKIVTRAYVARSIARALASYTKHYAKYTAQDRLWLADHNANHAHRNGVITSEEYAAIYHLCRAEGADPLKLLDAVRVALLTGRPVMPAVNAAAGETTAA